MLRVSRVVHPLPGPPCPGVTPEGGVKMLALRVDEQPDCSIGRADEVLDDPQAVVDAARILGPLENASFAHQSAPLVLGDHRGANGVSAPPAESVETVLRVDPQRSRAMAPSARAHASAVWFSAR